MRITALALVALGLAGSGCQDTHATEVESARGAADTLLTTCASGRPQDAVEVLNQPARQALLGAPGARAGCLELLGLRFPGLPADRVAGALAATRITAVRANDLSASVELEAPGGGRSTLELEKSRGVWYVAHPARSG